MKGIVLLTMVSLLFFGCSGKKNDTTTKTVKEPSAEPAFTVTPAVMKTLVDKLVSKSGEAARTRIKKGLEQVALLWKIEDGDVDAFNAFCEKNFVADEKEREAVFKKLSFYFESLFGHFNKISLDLQWHLHVDKGKVHPIDAMFGGYNVGAHLGDDFFKNKIAFIVALNFPYYSLGEKSEMSKEWTSKDWAYARAGDLYTSRVPAKLIQAYSKVNSDTDIYISQYNIFAGYLQNDKGESLFPEKMRLLSHWNLRDEIKANFGQENALEKQRMIYQVMKRIIDQSIPKAVVNSKDFKWNPYTNQTFKAGKAVPGKPEPDTRYKHLLSNFQKLKAMDGFYPEGMNTYIKRKFSGEMEIAQSEVEQLFIKLLSSPQVKKVAALIKQRLGRDLEPTDIWYNGFKPTTGLSADKLDKITKTKYPNAKALEADLENILIKLGFEKSKSAFIASKVAVDAARGSGHAWGAGMRSEKAHLRTRIGKDGMDYKGYNIAVHEFGHNVEQTITLHDVDHYLINGVPNTSFTEALAFIFQARDLEILGEKEANPDKVHLNTLSIFWNVFESMGVSLVDMKVWKWLYKNPDANEAQLKAAVIRISKEVWNAYFSDSLGKKDEPLLGIYSHMIAYPLYLSAYSYGYLINFQIEQHLEGKDFAKEVLRMYSAGRLTPQAWMKNAVGSEISVDPLLKAVDTAVEKLK